MTEPAGRRSSTKVSRVIRAPRKTLYEAFLDPDVLASWRAPGEMTAQVHKFDAREGGGYRMSLTYTSPEHPAGGKTSEHTDTFQGRFAELVPHDKIVERVVFESSDPAFAGEMTMTTTFAETAAGTEVTVLSEDIPPGIRPEDNEAGCRESLQNLARLVEE